MTKFYETVIEVLKQDDRFFTDEGVLLRNAVYEAAMQMDESLISMLLANETTKAQFFKEVADVVVFDKVAFGWVVNNRQFLPDSYTRFKNKIGLADENGDMFASKGHVELFFPYKDCVLEGGQSFDEQKKDEVFYNMSLAPDEIDRVLFPKVLSNAWKYEDGEEVAIDHFSSDDNLILKGNNLLALSSLLKRYEGRIKCIYIDPPYNTGNDSFKYNDKFSRSTWLTFMKNRLELAKRLLRPDGLIFVQLDYNESHYAKVLMDEIFGTNNFVNEIIWRRKQATSFGKSKFGITNDSIFMYSKSSEYTFYPIYSLEDDNTQKYIKERFVYDDKDGKGKYMKSPLVNSLYRPNLKYVFHGINPPKNGWLYSQEKMEQFYENGELIIPDDPNARIYRKIYLENYEGQVVQNIWLDIPIVNPMAKEQREFQTQKPEALIERIIKCCTVEGDIVLDYHLGSGTTAAVAHKMKRQYIGVEQMDYLNSVTLERLKEVVDGERWGISDKYDWQGGGSFVYCELAKANQNFVDEIQSASSLDEVKDIYARIIETGFISSKVNPKDIDAYVDEFDALSLDNQKRFLMELIDKNLLYVNYCDIDDEEYGISDEDKSFTRSFYGEV
ncbi:MAG: site-specific DNA-methyltransferase [Cellulosilyticaceae bacterium]